MPDSTGTLILSEFAGSAVEMHYALLTNPYDSRSLKEGLLQALILSDSDKQMRMQRLYEQVKYYDIDFWAEDFLQQLSSSKLYSSFTNGKLQTVKKTKKSKAQKELIG